MSRDTDIVDIYKAGIDAETLAAHYDVTPRQIQRIIKNNNASRTISESYRLAIEQGRMTYLKKPKNELKKRLRLSDKLRYFVLDRDGYRCVLCGNTAQDCLRLEVDHIDNDPSNNAVSNLQTLCDLCNKGKAYITTQA